MLIIFYVLYQSCISVSGIFHISLEFLIFHLSLLQKCNQIRLKLHELRVIGWYAANLSLLSRVSKTHMRSFYNKLLNTNTLIQACLWIRTIITYYMKSTFKFALIKEYVRTYMLSTTIMHIFQLNKQQVRQNSISSATHRQQKIEIHTY